MWTDDQLRLLIDERRNRNAEYYDIPGSSRVNFWNTIANIINERFGGTYTGQQCNNRFKNPAFSVNDLEARYIQLADINKVMGFYMRNHVDESSAVLLCHNFDLPRYVIGYIVTRRLMTELKLQVT
ncbi:2686_t:CDS:2 [Diversispora eburnea]|uniref:2686_t:CDS:1 n=1 Tax=Diversispora eburnea TaxID=1213867 RepID=A0A9N9C1Z3_9GLOM|nr:2686_t:CDS:2 [Diversispora eburnea]